MVDLIWLILMGLNILKINHINPPTCISMDDPTCILLRHNGPSECHGLVQWNLGILDIHRYTTYTIIYVRSKAIYTFSGFPMPGNCFVEDTFQFSAGYSPLFGIQAPRLGTPFSLAGAPWVPAPFLGWWNRGPAPGLGWIGCFIFRGRDGENTVETCWKWMKPRKNHWFLESDLDLDWLGRKWTSLFGVFFKQLCQWETSAIFGTHLLWHQGPSNSPAVNPMHSCLCVQHAASKCLPVHTLHVNSI